MTPSSAGCEKKNDEFCGQNEELCIQNEEFCGQNEEFCRFSDPGWSALGTYNGQLVQPTCFCMESLGNGAGVPVEQTGMVDHSGMGSMTRETWDMPASTYQQLANQIGSKE